MASDLALTIAEWAWNAVKGPAGASLVVAVCALGLTFWQAHVTRRHYRLSVRPHVTTWLQSGAQAGSYKLEIMNNGLGPASIKSFAILIDGTRIAGESAEPMQRAVNLLFPESTYTSTQAYLLPGYVMPAKERLELVSVQFTGAK